MASTANLTRKLEIEKAESEKYDNIARMAAQSGVVEDVKAAVKLKQNADSGVGELTTQIKLNNQQVERLREILNTGKQKIEKAKIDLSSLAARLEGAHLREDMAKAESEFLGSGGMSSIEDLRKLVEQHEDLADAQTSLHTSPEAEIEKRLKETYETPQTIDSEVQKYLSAVDHVSRKKTNSKSSGDVAQR